MSRQRLPAPDPSNAHAELSVVADLVERTCGQVGALAEPFLGTERDDVVATIHEAERQLAIAGRTLRWAIKTLER